MPNKICPKCQASKHVRVSKCDCGHAFYATKSEKISEPKTEIKIENKPSAGGFLSIIKNKESEIDHDSPGRGKKQCPKCQKYIGGVLKSCDLCGFDFETKSNEDKPQYEIKTFEGPGKGRKQCPKCKNYIGVRTSKCGCGHEFGAEDKKEDKKPRLLPVVQSIPLISAKPSFLSIVKKVNEQEEKEKNKEEKKLTKFKVTGQGRKTCPNCESIIPVATRTCDCGFFFEKKADLALSDEGLYIKYNKNSIFRKEFKVFISNGIDKQLNIYRDYYLLIENDVNLSAEELDAEITYLIKVNSSKNPEDLIQALKERFMIKNISYYWSLSDEIDLKEQQYPERLRKTLFGASLRNKPETLVSYNPIKLEWERYNFINSEEKYNPPTLLTVDEQMHKYKYPWWLKISYWKENWPPSEESFKEFLNQRSKWVSYKENRKVGY